MRPLAVVLLLAGAVAGLVGVGRPWVQAQVEDPVLGALMVPVSGTEVAPTAGALALLALAATLTALLTRGWTRTVALVLAVLSGGWLVWAGVGATRDPAGSVQDAVLATAASSAQVVREAAVTPWPWLVVAAGTGLVAGGVLGLLGERRRSRRPGTPDRADTPGSSGTAASREPRPVRADEQARRDAASAWEDLSAGRDPTTDAETDGPR